MLHEKTPNFRKYMSKRVTSRVSGAVQLLEIAALQVYVAPLSFHG